MTESSGKPLNVTQAWVTELQSHFTELDVKLREKSATVDDEVYAFWLGMLTIEHLSPSARTIATKLFPYKVGEQ